MNSLLVKKSFLIAGVPQPVGVVVTTNDDELARRLLDAGRVEPVPGATVARWTTKQGNAWSKKPGADLPFSSRRT